MKFFKKITLLTIAFMIIITLISAIKSNFYINSIAAISNPPNVGVLIFNYADPYMNLVK